MQWLIVEETKPTLTVHKDQEVKSTLRLIDEKGTSLEYDQLVFKKILRIQMSNYLGFIYNGVFLIITIVRIACKTIGYYCWTFRYSQSFGHVRIILSNSCQGVWSSISREMDFTKYKNSYQVFHLPT